MTVVPVCSGSPPGNRPCWTTWRAATPALVAESLSRVPDPLAAWLRPGPSAPAVAVAARLASAFLPPEAKDAAPPWLRPDQRLSFRRAVAAVRRHRGALLADGVGTGKTWIALALATVVEPRHPIHVIAPASLLDQWRRVAARTGLSILTHSHETLSRGRPPPNLDGFLVIDESHRFRTPSTRRYSTLAPWCIGRQGILLSATPVVNRLEDLAHQLLLLVRDDALAWSGVASLRARLASGTPGGIAELLVTGEDRTESMPVRREQGLRPAAAHPTRALLRGIASLELSRDPTIAQLLRIVLLRALASSPAAVAVALGRYRAMLQHAEDAAAAGRDLSRDTIRRFAGSDTDQLVFWPLVAESSDPVELALTDRPRLDALTRIAGVAARERDPKVEALADLLADGKVTLVFVTAMATVAYLRNQLARRGTAWCTGQGAGLDRAPVPREVVLDWFRPGALPGDGQVPRPTVLIATDVAAEGLDLPLVERVVHYDLPWTAVRLEQRSGRALRLGSRHESVQVVRFHPPPELGELLRQDSLLNAKAAFPGMLGLDRGPDAAWRQSARLAAQWRDQEGLAGSAVISGPDAGTVAGFRIRFADGSAREVVMARSSQGWSDDIGAIERLLRWADGRGESDRLPTPALLRAALRGLSGRMRSALRVAHGAGLGVTGGWTIRTLRRRLLALAEEAARARSGGTLQRIERGMRHLRRGHTAGEARRLEEWSRLRGGDLVASVTRLPAEPSPPQPLDVALIGVLVVEAAP